MYTCPLHLTLNVNHARQARQHHLSATHSDTGVLSYDDDGDRGMVRFQEHLHTGVACRDAQVDARASVCMHRLMLELACA